MEEVFDRADEFPFAIFDVFDDGIEDIVDSSLSCEACGRVLI